MVKAYRLHANSYLVKPGEYDRFVELIAGVERYWLRAEQPAGLRPAVLGFPAASPRGSKIIPRVTLTMVEVAGAADSSSPAEDRRSPEADAWQVSAAGRTDFVTPQGIRIAPALELLRTLV